MSREHALYRFYDRSGLLLYVGRTITPEGRLPTHRFTKSWWIDITDIKLERYPDLGSVVDAERDAIRSEFPVYNHRHKLRVRPSPEFVSDHGGSVPQWCCCEMDEIHCPMHWQEAS